MKKITVLIALLSCMGSAQAVYYCTDLNGKTSFQDAPCPELPSSTGKNGPLTTKEITKQIALDSVNRFNLAISRRDARSAVAFIGRNFVAMNLDNDKKRINADIMKEVIQRAVDGVSHIESKSNCNEPILNSNGSATVSCITSAKAAFHTRSSEGKSEETYTVIIEDEKAKFSRLEARKIEK